VRNRSSAGGNVPSTARAFQGQAYHTTVGTEQQSLVIVRLCCLIASRLQDTHFQRGDGDLVIIFTGFLSNIPYSKLLGALSSESE
jgi:hypothetical protein